LLYAELLHAGRRRHHLDSRRAEHSHRRGADLRLRDRRRGHDSLPVPSRLHGHAVITVIYLHGFASSPRSSKASFLAARLAARGVTLVAPDLNEPDFSTLTVTRMLDQVRPLVDAAAGDVALVGSSLGGYVAVLLAAERSDRVTRLALLAPALDFDGTKLRDLGDRGLDAWRETDEL